MSAPKLRVGIAGLGRMGQRHALNYHVFTPRAEVVAASSPDLNEHKWAAENLTGARIYKDYYEMLEKENLDAVVVAGITSVHAYHTIATIKKGLHVMCEKPLSLDIKIAQSVLGAYNISLKTHPNQKVMCGFSRRFDASYREAYERMISSQHGRPVVFKSQTADMLDTTGTLVQYAKTSGGIFLDCSIHDIDLMLWFLGENTNIKSLQAVGVVAVHTALDSSKDRDNAVAMVEFDGGKIAILFCSCMMASGQEDNTEIICEKGSLRVNMQGRKNYLEIHDGKGARRDLPKHYYERFKEAFPTQANEFTASCLDNTTPPVSLPSSVKAVVIGSALQKSLITGEKIVFDFGKEARL
ncbi:hypothetical protein N7449_010658 [Penicillium cf. viridicatum]|uniref:Uncharacterized protein n=1 Tax=Penicillium cf. viridicatum TaxID=2972119 RepID=A0A9W9IZ18_9EURO|nr:hypothetical protein N7449_010658 [Penicillium cf. viridicatum]